MNNTKQEHMSFLELAQNRYTTKKYNPNAKISEEQIEQLKEILRLSPSSINSQPWKFIFVSDENVKNELASVSYFNEPKIKDASHLVVFTAFDDLGKFEEQIRRNLPEGSVNYYTQMLKQLPEHEIKSWLKHQVYLSLGFFLGACVSMNIDSTPMEGIQSPAYNKILNLDGHTALFAVAIGYRDPSDSNQPALKPKSRVALDEVVQTV